MIKPRYLPPDACFDDPADKIDLADRVERESNLTRALASGALTFIAEWITRGRGGVTHRALRSDIAILSINPRFLPCQRPSAAWVGLQHGVSRQRASELWRDFADGVAPYMQFRGQRFRNRQDGSTQRRGRG